MKRRDAVIDSAPYAPGQARAIVALSAFRFAAMLLLFISGYAHSHGFDIVTRVVVCIAAAWSSVSSWRRNTHIFALPFAVIAFVFCPLIPLHFSETRWAPINGCTLIYFFVTVIFWSNTREPRWR